ncbi:MAG: magnesium and cobalt transport protein CorA, partial [Gammaproteobacteria bacterium]|nr:magnesium and cobalt transport protein CorA [Gammaproteobacteria bacterium]
IMAAIFIPLSFIAGVYGMNFSADSPWNMPELGWRYGYPAVLLLMTGVAVGLLWFFKKRDWF